MAIGNCFWASLVTGALLVVSAASPALAGMTILDQESAILTGATWTYGGGGYNNDNRHSNVASAVATYTFTGLSAGLYDVMATWPTHANRSSNVSFSLNGAPAIHVNQELTGAGVYTAGSTPASIFHYLGGPVAASGGQITVTLSNNNSGPNDYLLADAVALRPAGPRSIVMDNTSTGFATTFTGGNTEGFMGGIKYTSPNAGAANEVSTWSFAGVPAGRYRVLSTWSTNANRTQVAPYSMWDGSTQLGAATVNQEAGPNRGYGGDMVADGAAWRNLGIYTVGGGGLQVQLQGLANGGSDYVIADAVRLEPILSNGRSTRLGVFRGREWYFAESPAGHSVWKTNPGWGTNTLGDRPVMGDWDGDGNDTIGVFRSGGDNKWYFNNTLDTTATAFASGPWGSGALGDWPIAGDWDGDGKDGIGVFRSGNNGPNDPWYLSQSAASIASNITFNWGDGALGDRPMAGDWDGDGIDGVGVFRSGDGMVFLRNLSGAMQASFRMSNWHSGDWPVAADWDGDGIDGIGLFRPSTGQWFLDNNLDGIVDQINQGFVAADPNDLPVAGVDTLPEPASALLLALGAWVAGGHARRRMRRA